MIYKAYSIYDKAIEAYTRPFFMQAHGQAIRAFMDDANKVDSPVSNHPEDYALFHIGDFDESTGLFTACEVKCIARAHEVKESL